MNTKKILIVVLAILPFLGGCKEADKPIEGKEKKALTSNPQKEQDKDIVFVEIDSLMTQYQFCVEQKQALEVKGKQFESQMAAKMSQFEKAYMEFQKKVQNGAFTSQEQAQAAQQRVQALQQESVQLEQQLAKKMTIAQEHFNTTLRDSLKSFLNDYNRVKRYKMIVAKQGDNVLYADDNLNITKEVIAGMNKRYQSAIKK